MLRRKSFFNRVADRIIYNVFKIGCTAVGVGSVIAAALVAGALVLPGSYAFAAAEEDRTLSGFLSAGSGMGSLLDLSYGSRAQFDTAPASSAELSATDRMGLTGLDSVGATILRTDDFRLGLRTRGALRQSDDGGSLISSDVLDVGVFGELTLDDWRLSASVGQGLGERGGFAGDVGVKWASRFADRWRVEVGPELSWANEDYLSGLADFTPRRIPGRGLQLYDPTPGARDLTLSGSVEYSISNNWTVGGMIGAQRMMGDATSGPAVEDENEYFGGVSLGIRF